MTALVNANSLQIPLADSTVHMIACSPPYWGLRNYDNADQLGQERLHDCLAWARQEPPCGFCYVCAIRAVAAEAWRVLRDDGTFWLNLGDSYNGYPGNVTKGGNLSGANQHARQKKPAGYGLAAKSLKPKDLAMIPARVALALQADGWYVRSDIVWSKTNPISESVNGWRWEQHKVKRSPTERAKPESDNSQACDKPQSARDGREWAEQSADVDCLGCDKCRHTNGLVLRRGAWRPTSAHEHIFLLAKHEKYYCDKYAVTEPLADSTLPRLGRAVSPTHKNVNGAPGQNPHSFFKPRRNVRFVSTKAHGYDNDTYSGNEWRPDLENGRNKWNVWELSTAGYSGEHFAVWPEGLVEPMIKAGTSEKGVCAECGAPWARVINKGVPQPRPDNPNPVLPYTAASTTQANGSSTLHMMRKVETVDWSPTCKCDCPEPVPATVLDIFCGSGTTLLVARRLGRFGIGLDVSFDYLRDEAKVRLSLDALEAYVNGTGIKSSPTRKRPVKIPANQMTLI